MNDLNYKLNTNKYFKTLELDKIIAKVQAKSILNESKLALDELVLLNNLDLINEALSEVEEATMLLQRLQRFPLYFKSDIRTILLLINKGHVVSPSELLEISKFLDTIKANKVYLGTIENLKIEVPSFKTYIDTLFYPKELNLRIKEIISPQGEILDTASKELFEIKKEIADTEKNIQKKLQDFLSKYSDKLTENLISIRNDRYVIPVKNEFKNHIKGIVHDQSASGETFFIEPLIINEMNNNLNTLYEDEEREITKILSVVSNELASFFSELITNLDIIVHLDIVFSKAEYALEIDAKRPKINQKGILELYNCWHPLLNVEKIVSNNVIVGKDYYGIIITGPNTGGKTVLLKTIGLISLMIKAGLLVPCHETSNIMIFDNVFADIGDEQSIDQNLSTFSSHMKNIINIINNTTNDSLVLLDELGSGTDPEEGSALAIAIIEYLLKRNCLIVATSHYTNLKTYAFSSNKIINASVEFNLETLSPTYKLLLGVPGQSNALDISKTLGLNEEIIEIAKNYTSQNDDELKLILEKLVKQTYDFENNLNELESKKKEVEQNLSSIKEEKEKLKTEKERIIEKANLEAQNLIKKSSKKLEKLVEELTEMKLKEVKAHELADLKYEIKKLKQEANILQDYEEEDFDFVVNQSVYVENYNAYGIIIKVNKNNRYNVQIGNATITVEKKFLKPTEPKIDYIKQSTSRTIELKKNVSSNLDLRGLRYEEAYPKLEKFIDDAIYGGLHQVNIIHGFGTGVIRELVLNFLKNSPDVISYRFGGSGEGGQGATIVTLKE